MSTSSTVYGGTLPPTLAPPVSITRETVVPPATTPTTEREATLAFTGADLGWLIAIALLAAAVGLILIAAARKRTQRL